MKKKIFRAMRPNISNKIPQDILEICRILKKHQTEVDIVFYKKTH